MKIYKIRNKKTGLFSTGTMEPKWNNNGKVWRKRSHMLSHLTQFRDQWVRADKYRFRGYLEDRVTEYLCFYDNAEVVTYELTEKEARDVSL
jgi:hypothetical protein